MYRHVLITKSRAIEEYPGKVNKQSYHVNDSERTML
jgi:hypothetical protein